MEEQIVGILDPGYLLGAKCGACKKNVTHKLNLNDEQKATKTMFNRKLFLFTRSNFRAANDTFCTFFNDEKDDNERVRRSKWNRK